MGVREQCNACGKVFDGQEEVVRIQKEWGYFSGKDLECHRILLCERCYDAWRKTFKVPVEIEMKKEVL